jgi:ChrB, C-terminal domain
MKWATRAGIHIDRAACAWFIRQHIDVAGLSVLVGGQVRPSIAGPRPVDAVEVVGPVIDRVVRLQVSDPDPVQPGPFERPP